MTRPKAARTRVALVDDDTAVREGVAASCPDSIELVGAFVHVEDLLETPADAAVVILDMRITPLRQGATPLSGARAVREVVARDQRVLIYTGETRAVVLSGLMTFGALGVCAKSDSMDALWRAVTDVAQGRRVVTPAVENLIEFVQRQGRLPQLGANHVEVIRGRARGEPVKGLALRLGLSPHTVDKYIQTNNEAFINMLRAMPSIAGVNPDVAHSAAVIEQVLGIGTGDLMELGPEEPWPRPTRPRRRAPRRK